MEDKGMSLIELLMVLAVMSLLLGIGGRSLVTNLPEYRLKRAARELISELQKTKIQAVKSNTQCRIVFKPDDETYYLCTDKGGDGSWSSLGDNTILSFVDISEYKSGVGFGCGAAGFDATVDHDAFPSGFDFVSYAYNGVTFNSRGTCGSGYVYLENEKDSAYAVGTLSTGGVVLKKWNGSQWVDG